MLEYLNPEDDGLDENSYQKHIRGFTDKQPNKPDDREFTREEIRSVIGRMNNKKALGEEGLTAEI